MAKVRTRAIQWAPVPAETPFDLRGVGLALALVLLAGAASWAALILSVARFL